MKVLEKLWCWYFGHNYMFPNRPDAEFLLCLRCGYLNWFEEKEIE